MQFYLSILWVVLIVVFAVVEVSTAQLVSIWFVGGSVAALLLSFFNSSLTLQIVAFVVVSSVLLLFTRPVLAKKVSPKRTPTNADMVIGKEATVLSAISSTEHGRVNVAGQTWAARCDEPVVAGTVCRVVALEGVTLTIVPIKEEEVAWN